MNRKLIAICFCCFLGLALQARSQEKAGIWLDVPFVKQSTDGCGSAAISMLLQYWQVHGAGVAAHRADADAIQKQLYSRKLRGIRASDMQSYLADSGFRVFPVMGDWDELLRQLQKGRPLIASIQPGSSGGPFHYVVITGIDWRSGALFLNDPARGKLLRVSREDFENQWRPNRNWMLLAVPEKSS